MIVSVRFFKKRQQEKQLRRPRRDGDNDSVEDVDDDEFEKILGESRRSDKTTFEQIINNKLNQSMLLF